MFEFKSNKINKSDYIEELKRQTEFDEDYLTLRELIYTDKLDLTLSGQADIYAYLYLHTATFLNETGQLAIITSNSWLDVSYGGVMKEFFLRHFKVKAVIASWAEPWFEDASVNTVITVLEKEPDAKKRENNSVRFVKLKKRLDDLIPFPDLKLQQNQRWNKIDLLVRTIENAHLNKSLKQVTETIQSVETDEFRIRLVSQKFIGEELKEKADLAKWGKYLRAPDVYFDILDKCKDKLVPLKTIADVRFGIKTGINDFFYLEPLTEPKDGKIRCRNKRGWEGDIEAEFLRKVIKSPKEALSIIIDPNNLKQLIFLCDQTKEELKKSKKKLALNYIEWGETQTTEEGVNWSEVPSVIGRKEWFIIPINDFCDLMWPKAFNDRFLISQNPDILVADRLYEISLLDKSLRLNATIGLNSSLQSLLIEIGGRMNLGDGALDNMTYEAGECLTVNPNLVKSNKSVETIFQRVTLSAFDEVRQKDRKALDTIVLEALDLDPKIYLPQIYEGLTEMVRERLELPKMRKKKSTQKKQNNFEEIRRSVIYDCLPDGLRSFPEAFFVPEKGMSEYESLDFQTIGTSGQPLSATEFMGHFEIKDSTGQVVYQTQNDLVAEYAVVYSKHQKNSYSLNIPKNEKIIAKILKNYRNYISQLKDSLETNAYQKLHDHSLAEKMMKEIAKELGLE